jgi:hypothetical protein
VPDRRVAETVAPAYFGVAECTGGGMCLAGPDP